MKELYDKAITDASLDELVNFAKWMNERVGHTPVIVGGWAAYAYVNGFGSKDIDVIFPNEAVMSKVLADYFHREGYAERRRDFFQKEYYKEVMVKGQKIEIIIDAASGKRIIEVSGTDARIPWAWAEKHSVKHKLKGVEIYVPEIELLLTYKMGAILGRSNLLGGAMGERAAYLRSKVWKDAFDILSLSQKDVSSEKLAHFLKGSHLDKYLAGIDTIVRRYEKDADFAGLYPKYAQKFKETGVLLGSAH